MLDDAPSLAAETKRPAPSTDNLNIKRAKFTRTANPLQIQPLGNLLFRPQHRRARVEGLGRLGALPDELLLSSIFSILEGEDLVRCGGVSRAFFAWTRVEGIWKAVYISRTAGRLLRWYGSWRASYVCTFLRPPSVPTTELLPTAHIMTPTLHSDVLFQPPHCASFDPRPLYLTPSFTSNIARLPGVGLSPADLPLEPVILTGLMDDWPAMSPTTRRWTLADLAKRFRNQKFRAEATLTTLPDYEGYHGRCELDESPLYLFDSDYVAKTKTELDAGLGADYEVPRCFREDFFDVMGDERPDYRWLIVGPTRSGSTWHQDPNGTSAWNAVTVGQKAWLMFPPDITPPGVYVSADQGQVEAPLSLAEWFMGYYKEAKATYGPRAKDPALRGKMREGICNAGEIFFVPSGWWHIVVNLEPSIAVTQNFVSRRELPAVLQFMKHRPEQVSGFKLKSVTDAEEKAEASGLDECDESYAGVYEAFVEALKRDRAEVAEEALAQMGQGPEQKDGKDEVVSERTSGMWAKVKDAEGGEAGAAFSFGFLDDGVELDDDFVE